MVARTAIFRSRRYNSYVPACGFAHDVLESGGYETDFLTPQGGNVAGIASGLSLATAQTVPNSTVSAPFVTDTLDAPFGRNLQIVASGAATVVVTVRGKDYLGQGMREDFTLNGTTAVNGVKAFKWIDTVTVGTAVAGVTINIGFGQRLGLPYRMSSVDQEIANGAQQSVTITNLTGGSLTDPQTATTPDPRGLYTPTAGLNGATRILAVFAPYNLVNTNGNGGLYGIAHFNG